MPDRYNIEIRRICKEDKDCSFKTECEPFDKYNPSRTLREYWEIDTQSSGKFTVYILVESKSNNPIGLLRIRDELKGADPSIPELQNRPALYLSRVGLFLTKQNYHLGRVLLEYLFFLAKSKIAENSLDSLTVYLKCPKEKNRIKYYRSFGAKIIKEISEEGWGLGVVMSTEVYLADLKDEKIPIRRRNRKSDTSK
jgi:hypothetical protein